MIVAVHQPNFFPWLGYFQKIAKADIFVFLDEVQFSKGTLVNRVRLMIGGESRWTTCPIAREHGGMNINEILIEDSRPWRKKLIGTIEANYKKTAYFQEVMSWLKPAVLNPEKKLSEYNIAHIKEISRRIGLESRFIIHSEMNHEDVFDKRGSERLAAICKCLGADIYLAGDGAAGYERPEIYESSGIRMIMNNFQPVEYPQVGGGEFVHGLSVLDSLFNIGPDNCSELLRGRLAGS